MMKSKSNSLREFEKLVDTKKLMEELGLSKSFLSKARSQYGLPHYKIGDLIKYKMSEVIVWIEQRKVS